MCGILGAVTLKPIAAFLLMGLKHLAYRGYDSAGIAVIDNDGLLQRLRVNGKVAGLVDAWEQTPIDGHVGIAHTRWATHGKPSENNAHPHISNNKVALVHNGIIENYRELWIKLEQAGYQLQSETDSEVAAHLFHYYYEQCHDMLQAGQRLLADLKGAFTLAIIHQDHPHELIAIKHGCPLVLGKASDGFYVGSDPLALTDYVKEFIYLEDGDIAYLTSQQVKISNLRDETITRTARPNNLTAQIAYKGEYRHFMLKEIYEQPEAIAAAISGRISEQHVPLAILGHNAETQLQSIARIKIIACGASYHAGLVASYWFENLANIACHVEIAREFRYRHNVVEPNTACVFISQSGETADTLAALQKAKKQGFSATIAICNVPESSLVRAADFVLFTQAGPEIGVASTKAFTTQLSSLLLLALAFAQKNEKTALICRELLRLPQIVQQTLNLNDQIAHTAHSLLPKNNALFLGRGANFPIALEGALKLKEISYIHAEGYPSGELKHGPLALVDNDMPVIAVAPEDPLIEKLQSNLQEVRARDGKLIIFADPSFSWQAEEGVTIITMPRVMAELSPIIYSIPLQLLAYHVAVLKGTDVDQPRNLAKSVTVE